MPNFFFINIIIINKKFYINTTMDKKYSFIFKKKNYFKSKLIPLKFNLSDVGEKKYWPAVSKEWINSIYNYNNSHIKNLSFFSLHLKNILDSFFFSMFNNKFLNKTNILRKKKSILKSNNLKKKSFNKIYISNPEIKHNNFKTIITLYVYNREIISFKENIRKLYKLIKTTYIKNNLRLGKYNINKTKVIISNVLKKYKINIILTKLRVYILDYYLNKFKFEKNFIKLLENHINLMYMKKIEFNIINLKHFSFSNNITSEILALKLKKKYINMWRSLSAVLSRVKITKFSGKLIKVKFKKNKKDYINLIENKYESICLNYLIKNIKTNINEFIYNENYKKDIKRIILNFIKFKFIGGLKLELSGRLTKRYRADRAKYLMKTKGRLRDISSAYNGLHMSKYRGHTNANLEYSLYVSKRRIGSYAVKGWMIGV